MASEREDFSDTQARVQAKLNKILHEWCCVSDKLLLLSELTILAPVLNSLKNFTLRTGFKSKKALRALGDKDTSTNTEASKTKNVKKEFWPWAQDFWSSLPRFRSGPLNPLLI